MQQPSPQFPGQGLSGQQPAQQPNLRIPGAVNAATKLVPSWLAITLAVFEALLLISLFVPVVQNKANGITLSFLDIQKINGVDPALLP